MSLKAKMVGGLAAIVGTVVVLAVASSNSFFSPNGTRINKEEKEVTISGNWSPSPRLPDGVHVDIWVGSSQKVDKNQQAAPISRVYPVKSGDRAEIRIRALDDGTTKAACLITVNGLEEYSDIRILAKNQELICHIIVR